MFVVITGTSETANRVIAVGLEQRLFDDSCIACYRGIANIGRGSDVEVVDSFDQREERLQSLGALARILTGTGQIFITTITDVDAHDIQRLKALSAPNDILVVVVGSKGYEALEVQLRVPDGEYPISALDQICAYLRDQKIILDHPGRVAG